MALGQQYTYIKTRKVTTRRCRLQRSRSSFGGTLALLSCASHSCVTSGNPYGITAAIHLEVVFGCVRRGVFRVGAFPLFHSKRKEGKGRRGREKRKEGGEIKDFRYAPNMTLAESWEGQNMEYDSGRR